MRDEVSGRNSHACKKNYIFEQLVNILQRVDREGEAEGPAIPFAKNDWTTPQVNIYLSVSKYIYLYIFIYLIN